ncbi:hypothetical protein O7627_30690 [Solwaraspora sp. WMMD1047]|uniref:hypothetical protein n=1 Tax=Solwaraspora sp. WMMD1047 TaxID=3016102 RepID=UPI0024165CC1|nr:hypothetical protein [Solwaraspora sp. WMMD1047]MDG4833645.1 hypothetical protein [Solwaraspora sp. WMMD1047]
MTGVGSRWRSAALAAAVDRLAAEVDQAWRALLREYGVAEGSEDEAELARLVVADPAGHDWRVVDAALARSACDECGAPSTQGPPTCQLCAFHHGQRFGARETDRPAAPPGNEHASRVAWAVVQAPGRYGSRARAGFELSLPDLLAGHLPSTAQAQAARAQLNRLTPGQCDRVTSFAEVERLAAAAVSPPHPVASAPGGRGHPAG